MVNIILVVYGIITVVNLLILYMLERKLSNLKNTVEGLEIQKLQIDSNKNAIEANQIKISDLEKLNEGKSKLPVIQDKVKT